MSTRRARSPRFGISLTPEPQKPQIPLFLNLRDIRAFVRDWLRARAARKEGAASGRGEPGAVEEELPDDPAMRTDDRP